LRLMAGFVLFYTSRVIFKGHVTMEEIVFTLKHHWMTVGKYSSNPSQEVSSGTPRHHCVGSDWTKSPSHA
jgi:hypothetical protein